MQPDQPQPYQTPTEPPRYADQPPAAPSTTAIEQQPPQHMPDAQAVQWRAPEYLEHSRAPLWYVGFWVVVVALVLIAVFVMRSWSFALLIPAMAAALMIYSHRPPRILSYALSQKGLYINDQLHPMEEFKSFGVMQGDSMPSLMLIPTKRFKPAISVYLPAEMGETVVDMLGNRIPMQELRLDAFDKIIRKLRI